ncbi:MAG: ABC transporter ATP-binding protein [bacterium]|nr:ABC transporter ATP-binding protein [bacterium]
MSNNNNGKASDKSKVVIRLQGVTKTYRKGDQEVKPLENTDLEVREGEFFALMGPSGSGKSTLLNLVAGIDKATTGRVVVFGEDITEWSEDDLAEWRNRAVGYIFQQFNLMPVLTGYENVELPLLLLSMNGARRRQQVNTALGLVDMTDRASHYPRQMSGGQEQRIAIARALAADPQILLCDEPTGALDRNSAEVVMNLLKRLNEQYGKTIVLVTHDPHVASRATRVLHLEKGVLLEAHELEDAATREAAMAVEGAAGR